MRYQDIIRDDLQGGRPSFWKGFARGLDLFGALGHKNHIAPMTAAEAAQADRDAIARDWKVVGEDLQRAMDRAGCR
jgi:hypothetical protein